jgi:hypothetical protein
MVHVGGSNYRGEVPDSWIKRPGDYALAIASVSSNSSLSVPLRVRCGDADEQFGELCRRRCRDADGLWFDSKAGVCKKRPRMEVKAATDRLELRHIKTKAAPTYTTSVEVRLSSGDVDSVSRVEWSALSSEEWLRLGQLSGAIDSDHPVAVIPVTVDAASLNDTAGSGPLRASITVSSRMAGRSDLFENGTQISMIEVAVTIEAAPYLTAQDMQVTKFTGEEVRDNGVLALGDILRVAVYAFDYGRKPISRAGLRITASLIGSDAKPQIVDLQYATAGTNLYRGDIPSSWLEAAGSYSLRVSVNSSNVESTTLTWALTVAASNRSLYVAVAISSV